MSRVNERVLQLAVSLVSAIPLIALSAHQFIGYDGYWHVFIARETTWQQFWFDVRANAHPPLFYLLLGRMLVFGKTALAYRALGIAAAIGSSYLVGRIVRRCGASRPIAILTSIGFALSSSTVLVAVEVRSYTLATFFSLIAFRAFLDLVESSFSEPARVARVSFGVGMMLALLTHYSAAFVLVACVASPVYLSAVSHTYRRRVMDGLRSCAAMNRATLALPMFGVLVVGAHSIAHSGRLNHVPAFLHDPARESAAAFLLEQTSNLSALFVPFATGQPAQSVMALGLVAFSILALLPPLGRRASPLSWVPFLSAMTIGLSLALAGVLGRYPYGGELRHEYVLFPFLALALGVALGSFDRWMAEGWRRAVFSVLVGVVVAAAAAHAVRTLPRFEGRLVQAEMDRFRALMPAPRAVYVDQFNMIAFFMHHDDWDWRFSRRSGARNPIDLWHVSKGDRSFYVCRDLLTWMVNLTERRPYQRLNDCRRLAQSNAVALFALEQPPLNSPIPAGTADPQAILRRQAQDAGLELAKLQIDRGSVFAEFVGVASAPPGQGFEARSPGSPRL